MTVLPLYERQRLLKPIASLLSKSEKAQRKLKPDSWQYAMLRDNIAALHIAQALIDESAAHDATFEQGNLRKARHALDTMIARTETPLGTFAPGSAQHSLLHNRANALRTAKSLVNARLAIEENPETEK